MPLSSNLLMNGNFEDARGPLWGWWIAGFTQVGGMVGDKDSLAMFGAIPLGNYGMAMHRNNSTPANYGYTQAQSHWIPLPVPTEDIEFTLSFQNIFALGSGDDTKIWAELVDEFKVSPVDSRMRYGKALGIETPLLEFEEVTATRNAVGLPLWTDPSKRVTITKTLPKGDPVVSNGRIGVALLISMGPGTTEPAGASSRAAWDNISLQIQLPEGGRISVAH